MSRLCKDGRGRYIIGANMDIGNVRMPPMIKVSTFIIMKRTITYPNDQK